MLFAILLAVGLFALLGLSPRIVSDSLAKVNERLAAIDDEQRALLAAAEKDGRLDLNEEEDAKYEALSSEKARLQKQVARLQQLDEDDTPQPRRSAGASTPDPTRIHIDEPNFTKDPMKGFKSPREFLMSVMDAGKRGANKDARLKYLATAGSDEQSTFADAYGGFFVPEGMSPELLRIDPEPDPMAGRTRVVQMTNPTVKFNARVDKNHTSSVSGGLTVTRRAESAAASDSRKAYEQVKLEAHSLFGLAYATEELLTDSPVSFASLLAQGFNDEFTSRIIDERLNGTGVGEYLGVMNSPALITVPKETGQAADTIVYQNLIKMRSRCWRYNQAVWLYNHDCLPQLMQLTLPIGTGGVPMWQTSAREGEPDMLFGRPAFATEYCNTVGDLGDIVLVVWSEYLEGIYQPLQSAESMHVRFLNHERTFKFWVRNAGAPWWNAALTTKNSSNTLSPYVALAARA